MARFPLPYFEGRRLGLPPDVGSPPYIGDAGPGGFRYPWETLPPDGGFSYGGDLPTGDADMGVGLDPAAEPDWLRMRDELNQTADFMGTQGLGQMAAQEEARLAPDFPPMLEPGALNRPDRMSEPFYRNGRQVTEPMDTAGVVPGMGDYAPPLIAPTEMEPEPPGGRGAPFVKGEELLPALGRLIGAAGNAAPIGSMPISSAMLPTGRYAGTASNLAVNAVADVVGPSGAAVKAGAQAFGEASARGVQEAFGPGSPSLVPRVGETVSAASKATATEKAALTRSIKRAEASLAEAQADVAAGNVPDSYPQRFQADLDRLREVRQKMTDGVDDPWGDAARPPRGADAIPPRAPDVGPTGELLPDMEGAAAVNAIGTRLDQVTTKPLSRGDRIANAFRGVMRQGKVDEIATPIFVERAEGARRIENLAATFGEQTKANISVFTRDKQGRIPDLAGGAFPKGPTVQDVAAHYPEFEGVLTPKQQSTMLWLRSISEDLRAQWDEVQGVAGTLAQRQARELNTRGDIVDGGFYLPRGRADLEGADVPVKIPSGRSGGAGAGGGGGYKNAAKFDSMSQGIDAGYEYADIADAIRSHVKAIGTDINNRATANKMLELLDVNGNRVAQTAADRVDPQLRGAVQKVAGQIAQRRVTALRQNLMANAAGKSTEQAQRITASAERLANAAEARLWQRVTNDSTESVIHAAERELLILRREAAKAARRANLSETGAALKGAKYLETSEAIDDLSVQLFDLRGKYKRAQEVAKSRPRDANSIGLTELQGYDFPDLMANAANRELQKEIPLQGKGAGILKGVNALNSLYRGFKSTGDNSALGIQGLLGLGADQRAYAQALKANAKAWVDPKALGEFMVDFDTRAANDALPGAADWAKSSLHIGGSQTEFAINRGLAPAVQQKVKNVPVLGGAIDAADRAFGTLGDSLRMEWAQNELKTLLARNPGKTWQELPQEMDKIAKAMNRQTGYSPARFGEKLGDIGDLVLFAPRFLQARLETLAHALTPTNDLENRLARNALLSTVGYATLLTAGVNQLTGGVDGKGGTDWRPTIKDNAGKTKANPNFMKVRFNDKDWSLLGSWDSLGRMVIQVGAMADPTSAATPMERLKTIPDLVLQLGSGTTRDVALAIEMFNQGTANGKPVSALAPVDYAAWLGGHFSPISAGSTLESGAGMLQAAASGDVGKTVAGAVTTAGQFVGGKASDIGYSDIRDQVAFRMFQKPYADLDREQERAVRGDDAVAKLEAEFQPTVLNDKQFVAPLFIALDNKKAFLEQELARGLAGGLKGKGEREAIQKFKELSFEAGDTVFNNPEAKEALARMTVAKSVDIKDQLRDRYWNAPLPSSIVGGEEVFDHKAQDVVREQVLETAAAAGVSTEYVKKRDYEKYKDPKVRERLKAYDEAQETLRPYWELKDTYKQTEAFGRILKDLDAAEAAKDTELAKLIRATSVYKLYDRTLERAQEDMRMPLNSPIEKALVEWGHVTVPIAKKKLRK